jgi:hypothetical protein
MTAVAVLLLTAVFITLVAAGVGLLVKATCQHFQIQDLSRTAAETADDRDTWRAGWFELRGTSEELNAQIQELNLLVEAQVGLIAGELELHANREQ